MFAVAHYDEAVRKENARYLQPVLSLSVLFCFVWMLGWGDAVFALSLEQLDPEREWRVESIGLSGNKKFDTKTLLAELQTTARPWYMPWKKRPLFDSVTFETDLERVRQYYETQGYYQVEVTYDMHTADAQGVVALAVQITENEPVTVGSLGVEVAAESQTAVVELP